MTDCEDYYDKDVTFLLDNSLLVENRGHYKLYVPPPLSLRLSLSPLHSIYLMVTIIYGY